MRRISHRRLVSAGLSFDVGAATDIAVMGTAACIRGGSYFDVSRPNSVRQFGITTRLVLDASVSTIRKRPSFARS